MSPIATEAVQFVADEAAALETAATTPWAVPPWVVFVTAVVGMVTAVLLLLLTMATARTRLGRPFWQWATGRLDALLQPFRAWSTTAQRQPSLITEVRGMRDDFNEWRDTAWARLAALELNTQRHQERGDARHADLDERLAGIESHLQRQDRLAERHHERRHRHRDDDEPGGSAYVPPDG